MYENRLANGFAVFHPRDVDKCDSRPNGPPAPDYLGSRGGPLDRPGRMLFD
jgi:hypothetical protein